MEWIWKQYGRNVYHYVKKTNFLYLMQTNAYNIKLVIWPNLITNFLFLCCFQFISFLCNQNIYIEGWWLSTKLQKFGENWSLKEKVFNSCCRSIYKLRNKYCQWQWCTSFILNRLRKLLVKLDKNNDKTSFSMSWSKTSKTNNFKVMISHFYMSYMCPTR